MNRLSCLLVAVVCCSLASGQSVPVTSKRVTKSPAKNVAVDGRSPVFGGTSAIARAANADIAQRQKNSINYVLKIAKGENGIVVRDDHGASFGAYWSYELGVVRKDLISYAFVDESNLAGPHPIYYRLSANWIADGPKVTKISMRTMAGELGLRDLKQMLTARVIEDERAMFLQDGTIDEVPNEVLENFLVQPKGLRFLFDPYAVGPWATGPIEVDFSWDELRQVLSDEWIQRFRGS